MIVAQNLLIDPEGNYLLSITEDQTEVAQAASAIRDATGGWTEDRTMKLMLKVPPQEYVEWANRLGPECWSDPEFLKFYKNHRPEFVV